MNNTQTHNDMMYTAKNMQALIAQINPKGYALCPKYIKHTAKVRSVLTIDSKRYELSHPSRGMWIAKTLQA